MSCPWVCCKVLHMQTKNLKEAKKRLDFVATGYRKRQKLELKRGSWHEFQKGMNSECTLE